MNMNRTFCLSDFSPFADGIHSDHTALHACFEAAKEPGSIITIEPGRYLLDTPDSILLHSGTTVHAEGAEFLLPESLGEKTHRILFYGSNISDFHWHGGKFTGHVYQAGRNDNIWPPNAHTCGIYIELLDDGICGNLNFDDVEGLDVGGAVITVAGRGSWEPDAPRTPVVGVSVRNCRFVRCGKFMWDYGYLAERIAMPDRFPEIEALEAEKYMTKDLLSGTVAFTKDNPAIRVENMPGIAPKEGRDSVDRVIFCGRNMPDGVRRGFGYPVKSADGNSLVVIDPETGLPLVPRSEQKGPVRLIRSVHTAFHWLYIPQGGGPGKGGLDLYYCDQVNVTGCRMSACGDTMHIHCSHDIVFSNNQITGSRMGAFYIGAYCKRVTVTGNTVDGTNGSRVMSIERSTSDITVTGNIFRNGGRGSWINQPYNLIMTDNVFLENTNKCDPQTGRHTPETGEVEEFPEIYFTTWQPNGTYGPVIFRSNIIRTNAHNRKAAVAFYDGGHDIVMESNVFAGPQTRVFVGENCEMPQMNGNKGMTDVLRSWKSC